MNRKSLLLLGLAAGLATSHGVIADDQYIVPAVIYTHADGDRSVDEGISGGEIAIGKFLSDKFALEGRLGVHGMSGTDDLDMIELGLAGLWTFRRDKNISPYLLLGAGLITSDSNLYGDETGPVVSYGAGLNFGFDQTRLGLRLEYRARQSFEYSFDPRDDIVTLGFTFPFGKKDMPVVAPVAAPVASPAPDSDRDGVADNNDQCPDTYRGATVDAAGCELDDDNDGVANRLDDCLDTAEGVRVDVKGCEIKDVINLPGVNFESNSDRLLPGADDVLRDAAATLQKYPDLIVEVAGHTDNVGAADYNQRLSERRAEKAREYLVSAGASAENLSARGYGETQPIADNATAEGRASNRRVELRIIDQ